MEHSVLLAAETYISSITALFEELVEKQRNQPMYEWNVMVSQPVDGFDEFSQWFFFAEEGRVLTNRPNINFGFKFNDEEYNRFKQLKLNSEFEQDNNELDSPHCYYVKCGDDVTKGSPIIYEILTKVYRLSQLPQFNIQPSSHRRDRKFLKSYFHSHLPMMFCFDLPSMVSMSIITCQCEKVSSRLIKYGFGLIEIDNDMRSVKGYYKPSEEPKGFMASIRYGGQLSDTEAELITLLDLCFESFK